MIFDFPSQRPGRASVALPRPSARSQKSSVVSRKNSPALLLAACALSLLTPAAAQSPHTDQPLNNAPGTFRFAILPDRTGGNRPKVYESALAKLNQLQPEFVMSTGDLIDGYTTNPKVVEAQWQEFDALVNRLQMRFHYVPGNHDISNPLMLDAWRARHSGPWSSFVHENVLFLCLHTEDRPLGGLGEEQLAWVERTLAEHPDVRWTMLFFHRPLWRDKNQLGFERVRAALHGRNYTVFAGHYHSYLKEVVDGMNYYVIATAGGSSRLRGAEFGELDHVVWVTMKPDGPVVANLTLDGILPDDFVNAKNLPAIAALRDGSWLQLAPVVHDHAKFHSLAVPLKLRNPTGQPLRVHGTLAAAAGVEFNPAQIDRTIPPGKTEILELRLVAPKSGISVSDVDQGGVAVTLAGSYDLDGRTLELPAKQMLRLDWRHVAAALAAPVKIDGVVELGPDPVTVTRPMYIREEWDWQGAADGSLVFSVQHFGRQVYVAVRTTDDRVITSDSPDALQDKLLVQLRTKDESRALEGIAGTQRANVAVRATRSGLEGEFAFTLPEGESVFHLNVGWQDHDRPEHTKPSVLWWRDPDAAELGEFRLAN